MEGDGVLSVVLWAKAGDEAAWVELDQMIHATIYGHLQRRPVDADEVYQLTLVKIWRALPKAEFRTPNHFWSWVWQIARNTLTDQLRSFYYRKVAGTSIDDFPGLPSQARTPEEEAITNDFRRFLLGAIRELTPAQQESLGAGFGANAAIRQRKWAARRNLRKALTVAGWMGA